jgi:hypothetical protein
MFDGEDGLNHPVLQLLHMHFNKYFPHEGEMIQALMEIVLKGEKPQNPKP